MNENFLEIERPEIVRIREITRKLEMLNQEIQRLIDRLPLGHHSEVARLDLLINEQIRLVGTHGGGLLPPRILVFFDNAQAKALYLQQRYNEAVRKGQIRESKALA